MIPEKWAVRALRVFLVLLFGVLVVFQTLSLPGGIAYTTSQNPNDANLRWPLTAIAVFLVLCVEVVLVATWKLLTLVKNDRIFTPASLKWVDVIVWAVAAAWLVFVGMLLFVGFNADDPGMPMVLFLVTVAITVFGLLLVVMRALLRRATTLQSDMEAVI
ncbi:DUF2975 domain-containing protein [Amycolatopsis sp. SID8362]|uniref:DUF2975 domain-containing protein n=1 Tax=Amycolatopsis sp. SID8362 TaxID=2690346 RepID=UPI00136CA21A|nr:DUF2975 domain-containing protein [Amycolatopsis sp. SID8362]NBH02649.1 DUF2975 domain-containing protein [Amycolatopsis sp. SID8362]NED39352.1 DUF2975 domain-containing protein [Amycolatopsis sp. SID8362]